MVNSLNDFSVKSVEGPSVLAVIGGIESLSGDVHCKERGRRIEEVDADVVTTKLESSFN